MMDTFIFLSSFKKTSIGLNLVLIILIFLYYNIKF